MVETVGKVLFKIEGRFDQASFRKQDEKYINGQRKLASRTLRIYEKEFTNKLNNELRKDIGTGITKGTRDGISNASRIANKSSGTKGGGFFGSIFRSGLGRLAGIGAGIFAGASILKTLTNTESETGRQLIRQYASQAFSLRNQASGLNTTPEDLLAIQQILETNDIDSSDLNTFITDIGIAQDEGKLNFNNKTNEFTGSRSSLTSLENGVYSDTRGRFYTKATDGRTNTLVQSSRSGVVSRQSQLDEFLEVLRALRGRSNRDKDDFLLSIGIGGDDINKLRRLYSAIDNGSLFSNFDNLSAGFTESGITENINKLADINTQANKIESRNVIQRIEGAAQNTSIEAFSKNEEAFSRNQSNQEAFDVTRFSNRGSIDAQLQALKQSVIALASGGGNTKIRISKDLQERLNLSTNYPTALEVSQSLIRNANPTPAVGSIRNANINALSGFAKLPGGAGEADKLIETLITKLTPLFKKYLGKRN